MFLTRLTEDLARASGCCCSQPNQLRVCRGYVKHRLRTAEIMIMSVVVRAMDLEAKIHKFEPVKCNSKNSERFLPSSGRLRVKKA